MTLRIAFGYLNRVGKDTACELLKNEYGGVILRFAEPIYDISKHIQEVLGIEVKKDRKLLIGIGQALKSVYDENVWARVVEQKLLQLCDQNIFIADLRGKAEADMLRKHGFILINIERDCESDGQEMTDLQDYEFDFTIYNYGTKEKLLQNLNSIIFKEKMYNKLDLLFFDKK